MNKQVYVKPQMEELMHDGLTLLTVSHGEATEGFARQNDFESFDDVEE